MSSSTIDQAQRGAADAALREVENRVLWLSTAIIDHANRVRPNPSGLKVGGHQASSASMVSLMTALWFRHLRPEDRVSVKPHVVPEALAAADRLAAADIAADVICVTSPGLLYRAVRSRQGHEAAESWILDQVFPAHRATPLVTVLDGHPHTLAFLATINQVRTRALGVTRFGQSGALADVYRYHGIDADSIVRAALDLTD
jgi:pyruvate dehydrogenase complex dehydrogenase (E1) component